MKTNPKELQAIWPDVYTVPSHRLRAAVAERLWRHAVRGLPLHVEYGSAFGAVSGSASGPGSNLPTMLIRSPEAFFQRIGSNGLIGFGEAYMSGDWDADDLVRVLTIFASRLTRLVPAPLQRLRKIAVPRARGADRATPEGARLNAHRHYDLSNELFAQFLDPTMTYSAALFPDPSGATWEGLAEGQHRKIDRLLDQARVGPGTRMLEVGTGWGELAIRAAQRGAEVTSVTLSQEQLILARRRVADLGLQERCEIALRDYREVEGTYDAVVSVEMIEAVGAEYWKEYFATLRARLAPRGRAAVQAITMPHDRMVASLDTRTWVQKYIFPGGMIPSIPAIEASVGGLRIVDRFSLRRSYADTLRLWRERYLERREAVDALGFDEVFHRMWTLYLAYSEAGFRSEYLNVWQLTLERP
ncbi:class I SAM-dependent methyltransferase [Actinomadura barringtoniae]|uniref:Class I SAM-dependent methyltransferase n=1 Tax=Actinomadura barringtoniae TaxID=1427535 RepID=A0A939T3C3_9ACTN|nr:cyclopropane-fatty-acyl-phospholipid synthase family protein [Actinomadura barringtoniae]MBO2450921.1 class I SAM-dependent methyltransferase [Actinomadura barringtoniae]